MITEFGVFQLHFYRYNMEAVAIDRYFHYVRTSTRSLLYLLSVWSVSSFLADSNEDVNSKSIANKSFFANVDNPINQYMVKWAWGWTFYPLCILFTVTSLAQSVSCYRSFIINVLNPSSYIFRENCSMERMLFLGSDWFWTLVFGISLQFTCFLQFSNKLGCVRSANMWPGISATKLGIIGQALTYLDIVFSSHGTIWLSSRN